MTDQPSPVPFVPLSRGMIDGSLWEADLRVRVLFVTMLFISFEPARRGTVDITLRKLAGRAGMSPKDVRYALDVLMAPDPDSRSKGDDGRRIERLDDRREWGWRIVNWSGYEQARERMLNAARQARFRARNAGGNAPVTDGNAAVTPTNVEVEVEVEVEDEVEGESGGAPPPPPRRAPRKKFTPPALEEIRTYLSEIGATFSAERFLDHHIGNGWTWGKAHHPVKDWRAVARTWKRTDDENPTPRRNGTALIGAHPPSEKPPRDIDTAPPDIQDIAHRIAHRQDTTEAEDDRYAEWLNGGGR